MRACLVLALLAACSNEIEAYPAAFAGVGLELENGARGPSVVKPLPGSPAEAAGVLPGDRLVAIDGLPTRGREFADVVARLRGPPGSKVSLLFERAAEKVTVDLTRSDMALEGRTPTTRR